MPVKVLSCLFLLCSFFLKATPTVELRKTPEAAYGYYLKEVFDLLYSEIGYEVRYVELPFVREIDMASKSQIGGVLARDIIIEESSPELTRVEVPLFAYEVIMLANTKICGRCTEELIDIVGYLRGGKIYQAHIENFPDRVNKVAIGGMDNLAKMLEMGRVDAIITSDILLPVSLLDNPDIVIVVLEKRFDYHYLSPQNKHLKEPLEQALLKMHKNGKIRTLKKNYDVK